MKSAEKAKKSQQRQSLVKVYSKPKPKLINETRNDDYVSRLNSGLLGFRQNDVVEYVSNTDSLHFNTVGDASEPNSIQDLVDTNEQVEAIEENSSDVKQMVAKGLMNSPQLQEIVSKKNKSKPVLTKTVDLLDNPEKAKGTNIQMTPSGKLIENKIARKDIPTLALLQTKNAYESSLQEEVKEVKSTFTTGILEVFRQKVPMIQKIFKTRDEAGKPNKAKKIFKAILNKKIDKLAEKKLKERESNSLVGTPGRSKAQENSVTHNVISNDYKININANNMASDCNINVTNC